MQQDQCGFITKHARNPADAANTQLDPVPQRGQAWYFTRPILCVSVDLITPTSPFVIGIRIYDTCSQESVALNAVLQTALDSDNTQHNYTCKNTTNLGKHISVVK